MSKRTKTEPRYDRLQYALRHCNGKLVLVSGTEHNHTLYNLLYRGLRIYGRASDWDNLPTVPRNALGNNAHEFWDTEQSNQLVGQVIFRLGRITPAGWDFRTPIYGLALEYGWFSKRIYPIPNKIRNSVWENV